MTYREALARFFTGGTRSYQDDYSVPYETLPSGLRVCREQPTWGPKLYPELPCWQWAGLGQADAVLALLDLDPAAELPPGREPLVFQR